MTAGTLPYRPCVGIMLLNKEGLVFMGRRLPDMEHASDQTWQMPQGGIDGAEDPLEAAKRELYEETGAKTVSLLREASNWFYYDLPPELIGRALRGQFRGQRQRWFAFRFEGEESEISVTNPPGGHSPEFAEWAWLPMTELTKRIIAFKRPVYEQVVTEFKDLAP